MLVILMMMKKNKKKMTMMTRIAIITTVDIMVSIDILMINISMTSFLLLVGWLLNVPATFKCITGTDLLRQ